MKCGYCDGSGKVEVPVDLEVYNREFDKLDQLGTLSMGECRKRALAEARYIWKVCPKCEGTGVI